MIWFPRFKVPQTHKIMELSSNFTFDIQEFRSRMVEKDEILAVTSGVRMGDFGRLRDFLDSRYISGGFTEFLHRVTGLLICGDIPTNNCDPEVIK